MKLVRFQDGSRESYGVMTDAGIADVGELLQSHCPTLESALSLPGRVETAIKDAVVVDPESVVLLSPVTNPGKIVCVGLNYKSHIAETGRDTPDYPILFTRYPDSLVGSGAPLVKQVGISAERRHWNTLRVMPVSMMDLFGTTNGIHLSFCPVSHFIDPVHSDLIW